MVNYFIGNDKSKWRTNIPTYDSVNLGEVYKGIDLSLKAYGKTVEKVFTVQPDANPKNIKLKMEGAKSIKINDKGELEAETGHGPVKFSKPIAFQEKNGKRENVQVAYHVDKDIYRFDAGNYDRSLPLIIDPALVYSTYLGGNTGDDIGEDIAVDSNGNAYVIGTTGSSNFPTVSPLYGYTSGRDAFVAKLNPVGDGLVYSTYLGGTVDDFGRSIALAESPGGEVFACVAGGTE